MTAGLSMIAGLGIPELLLIIVIVLIIFGPKRLPQLGSSLGKTVKNIREGMEEDESPVVEHKKSKNSKTSSHKA